MARSAVLDLIAAEIELADMSLALEGGGSLPAFVGAEMLKKIGYPPDGKAEVKDAIGEKTLITITWPGET